MSEHILKRHNKTLILYHIVCPAKYRQKIFTKRVEQSLQNICIEIGKRYEIHFVEIGADEDHVHFLVQSVPVMSPSRIVQIIKSITAKKIFKHHLEVKKLFWGGINSGQADSISTLLVNIAMKPSSENMSKSKERPINKYIEDS